MPRARKSDAPRRIRVDPRKDRTRQRLIDATLDIVRAEGKAALTTGRIANAAGIKQPGFYAHFKNVDDCLRAAAEQLSTHIVDLEAQSRRAQAAGVDSDSLAALIARTREGFQLRLENRRMSELLAFCRYDDSPLGQVCRDVAARARLALEEDLWDVAVKLGIRGRYLREVQLMAELIVSTYMAGIELLLSGANKDVDAVSAAVARVHFHHVRGEFRRMLREQGERAEQAGPAAPTPKPRRSKRPRG